jgi:hypothetical protein
MGVVEGIASHHTVTALVESGGEISLAAVALALGESLAFDSTMEREIAHIEAIDAYHKSLGWGGFAYHGIAFASGRAYLCGDPTARRAHVANMNHLLHGLAFNGDFSNVLPPGAMLIAGANFIKYVRQSWGAHPIKGHSEWGTATACPGQLAGFDWTPYLDPGLPPPPTGVRVSQVVRTSAGYLIRFAGSGTVEIPEGAEWPLEIVSEDGALTAEIRAP